MRASLLTALPLALAACGDAGQAPVVDENGALPAAAAPAPPPATAPALVDAARWSGFDTGAASFVRRTGDWARALFLCDGTDRPLAVALTVPDGGGDASLVTADKRTRRIAARPVTLGSGDPGAGQIYYPLTSAGQQVGAVHAVNDGIMDGATTPTVTSLMLGGERLSCRWQPETRILAMTARRSVLVTGPVGGPYVYRSFDYDRVADQTPADGGRTSSATQTVTRGEDRAGGYVFRNGVTEYRVIASGDGAAPGGSVEVWRGGRRIQSEPMIAYTLAGAAAAIPDRATARYACDGGATFTADFDNRADTVTIAFADGRAATLRGQRPASGIWYASPAWELRGKGDDATLTGPAGALSCRAAPDG